MAVITTRAASALARLRNRAKQGGISYQHCLQLFVQEEFLRRLSLSPYKKHLVLKGGLFIYSLTRFQSRPTIDVDFLMKGLPNGEAQVKAMVESIIATDSGNDFVTFTLGKIKPIALEKQYPGLGIQLIGHILNVRVPFGIDLGVGDVITPAACERDVYAMLPDYTPPRLLTYSLESSIAEKLDAMLRRLELNSRMKDFYDVYFLSRHFPFDGVTLAKALHDTMDNRQTPCDDTLFSRLVSLENHEGMLRKWENFMETLHHDALPFGDIMRGISRFLSPVVHSAAVGEQFAQKWQPDKGWIDG